MRSAHFFAILAVTLLAQGLPQPARAALGGAATVTNATTGTRLKLIVRQTAPAWKVQDTTSNGGTVVHEYVSTLTGKVFAVSWNGRALPDLGQYLGGYFGRYVTAAQRPAIRHRLVKVDASDLVIVSEGHERRFTGKAWLPAQLPSGFTAADIQ